jgi:hypothetical protein
LGGGRADAGAAARDSDGMATTERAIRSYLDGDVSLELPIPAALASPDAGSPAPQLSLIACSRCLRVLRDGQWVRAERVIHELRSFEYDAPPHFAPVLCPVCTLAIAQARVPLRRATVRPSGYH